MDREESGRNKKFQQRRQVEILGVRVDVVTLGQAVERVGEMIKKGGQYQIVTPNPEHVMLAQKDEEFRQILNSAALSVPDGAGLVWASRVLASVRPSALVKPVQERVTGADLMEGLCAKAAQQGWSVFLLGAGPGVATQAARQLQRRYPELKISGTSSADPVIGSEKWPLTSHLSFPVADFLFVAYGAPAQEKWIARHLPGLPVKVAMGVGGAFDFLAGRQKRAPLLFRQHGLEWFWRLLTQPWRARRQLALVKFALEVLKCRYGFEHSQNFTPPFNSGSG